MTSTVKERTNTQISLSFGRDELELLEIMDEARKKEHMTRSGWVKNQIRKQNRTGLESFLLADY